MNLQILDGEFKNSEAIDLLSKIVGVKIKFHEEKIDIETNAEDIKMRESRIKQLQNDLAAIKNSLLNSHHKIAMNCNIEISG
jgi:3-methyladenine DNA glycosylase/8-oxoguanine DNA glycosylase